MRRALGAKQSSDAMARYVSILRRRWPVAVGALAVALVGAIVLSVAEPPRYRSSANVVISRGNIANAVSGVTDPNQSTNDFARIVTTRSAVARSPDLAKRVIDALPGLNMTPTAFLHSSKVTADIDADLLRFSVEDESPSRAQRLVNAYATLFVSYSGQLDTASVRRALAHVRGRLEQPGVPPALLSSLRTNEQRLSTLATLQTSSSAVVAPAETATRVAPRPAVYVAVALLLGLMAAYLLVLFAEAFDPRVRSVADVEQQLHVPMIGSVPKLPATTARAIALTEPRHLGNEAYRALRTSIEFATVDTEPPLRLLVTSSVPQEGKTTTAFNLAVTAARAGATVALVDLDLRRPAVHVASGLRQTPGLTEVVRGSSSLAEAWQEIDVDPAGEGAPGALRVLTSGALPLDPGEFVARHALRDALDRAAQGTDLIIVDTAPALVAGDAVVVGDWADAIVLVVRLRLVRRRNLNALRRALEATSTPVLGFVANQSTFDDARTMGYEHAASEAVSSRVKTP